ncbi:hypothetical protein BGZ65_006269, partial [Modicella reniformis]
QRDMVSPLSFFENLTSLGLPAQTICPQLVTIIQSYPNALTSLVIENAADDHAELSQSLHTFLCSSPHLKHLKAPNIKFDDRLLNLRQQSDATVIQRVWACRGLLSLNISFGSGPEITTNSVRDASRVIYGYLSQVCPRLERLTISRDRIACSLDSGLCLLSALDDLRSLEIRTRSLSILHIWDFGWMNNEPTMLQRLVNKMSFNESRLQKSLRARYEWLGYEDCRTVDRARLEELGVLIPIPYSYSPTSPTVSSDSGLLDKSRRSRLSYHPPYHHHNHHHHHHPQYYYQHRRNKSNNTNYSNNSGTISHSRSHSLGCNDMEGRMETGNHPIRWPFLERIKITQTYDRRHQAQALQGYLKKLRPDVESVVM